MKKNLIRVSGLILAVSLIMPLFASAQTDTSVSSQVQSLLSQIQSLRQQLHTLIASTASSSNSGQGQGDSAPEWGSRNGTTTPSGIGGNACPRITRDLHIGQRGTDVADIQSMLIDQGLLSASSSTGYFGQATARAMAAFQREFNISSTSTGVVGSLTRAFLNNHCDPAGSTGEGMASTSSAITGWNGASEPPVWNGYGTSTLPAWDRNGTTTRPQPPAFHPGYNGAWNNSSSSIHDMNDGYMGSSTPRNIPVHFW